MLQEILERIEGEIEELTRELNVDLPFRIQKAVELGDLRENSEYKSALERQQFVQARIGQLSLRASELSRIDVTHLPADRVGFGSKVTVRDLASDSEMVFTLLTGDYIDFDKGQISVESPIGRGLTGAQVDDEVTVTLPAGERRFRVIALQTLADQLDAETRAGAE